MTTRLFVLCSALLTLNTPLAATASGSNALDYGSRGRSHTGGTWTGMGGPPPFPNRFYYDTLPIPLALTQGKTSAALQLYENNLGSLRVPGRPIYSAFSHVDPCFLSESADATGLPPKVVGQIAPVPLSTEPTLAF